MGTIITLDGRALTADEYWAEQDRMIAAAKRVAAGQQPRTHTWYINYRGGGEGVETVDEADSYEDAKYMLNQYAIADPAGLYSISSRPRTNWKED